MPRFTYVGPWAEAEVVLLGRVVARGESFDVDDDTAEALAGNDNFQPASEA